jgi:hypothetical protein
LSLVSLMNCTRSNSIKEFLTIMDVNISKAMDKKSVGKWTNRKLCENNSFSLLFILHADNICYPE